MCLPPTRANAAERPELPTLHPAAGWRHAR